MESGGTHACGRTLWGHPPPQCRACLVDVVLVHAGLLAVLEVHHVADETEIEPGFFSLGPSVELIRAGGVSGPLIGFDSKSDWVCCSLLTLT